MSIEKELREAIDTTILSLLIKWIREDRQDMGIGTLRRDEEEI